MNPDIKASWVAALRSGYYKQGKYKLQDLGGYFDPLGVLCGLAVREDVIDPPKRYDDPEGVFFGYAYYDAVRKFWQATGLPQAVCEWSGLSYHVAYRIALRSDEGESFDKLADWIEENL